MCLTRWMRSLLVDWMVEIQESFELNHETLYLGVKLVDLYLSKITVSKETLQLVGAAAMFVASKYDERIPPLIDDFLYICDGAYTRRELIRMEINLLKVCDFNLGIPISYRFLRRYARVSQIKCFCYVCFSVGLMFTPSAMQRHCTRVHYFISITSNFWNKTCIRVRYTLKT